MRLELTADAERDLDQLHYYGTVHYGTRQADLYLRRLLDAFDEICANPLAVVERRVVKPPVRLRAAGAHHVLYRAEDDRVLILRVLHHSANWIDRL